MKDRIALQTFTTALALLAAASCSPVPERAHASNDVACKADGSGSTPTSAARPAGSLTDWLAEMRACVKGIPAKFEGDAAAGQRAVLDVYINRQEHVEVYYGEAGKVSKGGPLGDAVMSAEQMFHNLMVLTGSNPKADVAKVRALADSLDVKLAEVSRIAIEAKVELTPPDSTSPPSPAGLSASSESLSRITRVSGLVEDARALYRGGNHDSARRIVEHAYLEEFEPIEPLLMPGRVAAVEELVHMRLRPRLASGGGADVDSLFGVLGTTLQNARDDMQQTRTGWFGGVSAFFIIVREGLEAVLLIAAMIAYLSRDEQLKERRRSVWGGALAGLGLTLVTWAAARTLIPISGGSRELLEGITALVAVVVLLYVSHWIFRRTYMREWKEFIESGMKQAVGKGSAIALASLSFAAVYREGFETVLFYEALLVDQPGSAVAAGFFVGAVVIAIAAVAIIRAGVKLPLKMVFGATTIVLLFLSVAILGKGLYNLQEAGVFSPHPLEWLPSSELLGQLLGFYPMAETLLAQLALVTLVVGMYVVYRRRSNAQISQAAA